MKEGLGLWYQVEQDSLAKKINRWILNASGFFEKGKLLVCDLSLIISN